MVAQPIKLSKKTLGVLLDMPPSLKLMDEVQLLNLKSLLMVITLLKLLKELLKEFYHVFLDVFNKIISSLKDVF
jgi:hypothetical protein